MKLPTCSYNRAHGYRVWSVKQDPTVNSVTIASAGRGVVHFGLFTVFGAIRYGILAGLFAGVGGLLYGSWKFHISDIDEASADRRSVSEGVPRAGGTVRLATFGIGLYFGAFAMVGSGVVLDDPDPLVCLAAAVSIAGLVTVIGPSVVEFRQNARRSEGDRDPTSDSSSAVESGRSDVRPPLDALGRTFGGAFAVSVVSFFLSVIGTASYMAYQPGEPTLTASDLPVIAIIGSWGGMVVSLSGYTVWSVWQLRTLGRETGRSTEQNAVETLNRAATVFGDNDRELGPYDRRLRRTLWSLFATGFVLLIPVAAIFGSPPGE